MIGSKSARIINNKNISLSAYTNIINFYQHRLIMWKEIIQCLSNIECTIGLLNNVKIYLINDISTEIKIFQKVNKHWIEIDESNINDVIEYNFILLNSDYLFHVRISPTMLTLTGNFIFIKNMNYWQPIGMISLPFTNSEQIKYFLYKQFIYYMQIIDNFDINLSLIIDKLVSVINPVLLLLELQGYPDNLDLV